VTIRVAHRGDGLDGGALVLERRVELKYNVLAIRSPSEFGGDARAVDATIDDSSERRAGCFKRLRPLLRGDCATEESRRRG
jgi:hypothetical protein